MKQERFSFFVKEKYGIINIEAQKCYNAGYPIPKRADYYTGRLISSQKGTIFKDMDYGRLRKVYSIWIIMNVCERKKNSITVYETRERQICGDFRVRKCNYDMQAVVMIGLGDHKKTDNKLLKILDILFAKDTDPEEKMRMLEEEGLAMTDEVKKEVNVMCNLGEGIYEQGIEQGIDIGENSKAIEAAKKLLRLDKISNEEIAECTGLTIGEVKKLEEEMCMAV